MTRKAGGGGKPAKRIAVSESLPADDGFDTIVQLINAARQRAYQASTPR